jgi:hypothetical protein
LIYSPTWNVTNNNPPIIENNPTGFSWADEQRLINYVKSANLEPVLFPQLIIENPVDFWNGTVENKNWLPLFYKQYERFIYNYADLAQIMGAKAIIIGDPTVSFSMINNDYAQEEWSQIVKGVRSRFSGMIIGAYSIPNVNTPPDWLKDTDLLYALFSPTVINSTDAINEISNQLDILVYPLNEKFSKPIIIGSSFVSTEQALTGCVDNNGSCSYSNDLFLPSDVGLQASLYNALSVSTFSKPWITGLISRSYYPFLLLSESGPSIYGKPAYDVLWFWFHFIQNLS